MAARNFKTDEGLRKQGLKLCECEPPKANEVFRFQLNQVANLKSRPCFQAIKEKDLEI